MIYFQNLEMCGVQRFVPWIAGTSPAMRWRTGLSRLDGWSYQRNQLLIHLMEPNRFECEARFAGRCLASGKERNAAIGPSGPTEGWLIAPVDRRCFPLVVGQTKARKAPRQQTRSASQMGQ